ncbi:DUF637 domain-containing protein, partial [Pseudomonas mosselii]|nr:DUF637 domain-containing protein [Pseudomonas mosselii]
GLAAGVKLVQGVPERSVPSVSHKYLVETNPVLTDLKQFLSSDYMLGQLNIKPDQAIKRLGDGLYEQRLIREAVVARTGQRYIDGMTSDETLFRYLMDNAIASKDKLSLSVGVSLSAEQVAALTHDIVWMEQVEVNGEKVLAPVLYLAHANGRVAPNGALIQGRDVNLISGGELVNVGTLRATNNLAVSAINIGNAGLMEAGGRLDMLATDSIRNAQGGIIAGREVSLTALTGDVINERSVTRLEGRAREEHVIKDLVDTAARIEAANDLTITAGRDIGIVGGAVQAGRDIDLDAGRDLYIGSQEGLDSHEYQRRRERGHDITITQYGSEVKAGGNLTATAGQDLSIVASEIEARRDLALQAGRDVTLAAAANEEHSYVKGKEGKTKFERQKDDVEQQSAEVKAGGDLTIDAGRDLRMVASKASAGDEAYLVAGDKLELLAANDSQYSLYDMNKKGGWGSKKTQRDEVTDVKAVGSEITSGGDLTLESGGDQLYQGAKLASGADLTIDSGGSVTFEAVKDMHQESHEKSKGDLAWNSMKGKGSTDETLRQSQLTAKGDLVIKAVDGLKVDVKHVDQATISQSIDAMVAADPQLAWLKEVEKRGDVDWRQVKEVHDSFKYSHSGLGAGAQMVIAILIAYFTAGAASGLVASGASAAGASTAATTASGMWAAGTGASLQGIGWANAMVTAGAMGMTSNAAISTINNKGNLSLVLKDVTSKDALRGYAVSGITAGLTAGLFDGWMETKTDVAGAAGATGVVAKTTAVLPPGGLSTLDGIGRFAGSQMLQNGTSAVLDRALGGNSSFSDALRNSLVNTFAAAGFKWVGDISAENKLNLKDGGLPKIALHALMGGLAAEAAGGNFRMGALSAGVNEAVVGLLADQYTKMPKEEKNRLLMMNSQLIGVLTAAAAGGDAKDLQTGSWVASSATSYNRLLHDAEKKALTTEAAELQKRLGKPGTDLSWDDLLLLAANAQVDETENKRLQALLQMYDPKKPEGQHFAENLLIAQQSIAKLAAQDIVLTWKDGRPITADGDEVKAFQSTGKQFQDHGLFNTDSKWTQASGNSWAGEVDTVPEAWKRQFGEKNAAIYMREIGQVSSSPAEMKDLMERISVIATGGVKDVTVDLDVALAMTGAPAVLRALLAKRVSAAMAEASTFPKNLSVHSLDKVPDAAIDPALLRDNLTPFVRSANKNSLSIAAGSVEIEGQTQYFLSVSGKGWRGDAPDVVTLAGVEYKVVKVDSKAVESVVNGLNGSTNFNHAEQKLMSYFQDVYAGKSAKVSLGVQNTSASNPGMCSGCTVTSKSFAESNPSFSVRFFEGSSGVNP